MLVRVVRTAALALAAMLAFALETSAFGAPHVATAESSGAALPVDGSGSCPDPHLVATMLRSFDLRAGSLGDRGPPQVVDLGDRFRVSVAGHMREYDDTTHDCAERARIAAVFVALTLSPPELSSDSPPSAPPPVPAPRAPGAETIVFRPAPRPTVATPPWGRFEAAGRFEGAPSLADSRGFFEGGAMVRMALGWSVSWGVEIGLGLLASRIAQLEGIKAREQRFPFELGLRGRTQAGAFEVSASAGLSGAWFTTEGNDLPSTDRQSRVDLGLGAALQGRWPTSSRMAAFLGIRPQYFPRTYEFNVDGRGMVGSTPKFRLAGELGLSVALE